MKGMEKKVICYDIDGTLTTEMLFMLLVAAEHKNGILNDEPYARLTGILKLYKTGAIEYEDAIQQLVETHASGLKGNDLVDVENHAVAFVESHAQLFRPFAHGTIKALKNTSQQLVVTAEPQYVAQAVVSHLGLDDSYATSYEVVAGKFTGIVSVSLAHRSQKAKQLSQYEIFAAFGDSIGDIDMLSDAKNPICIDPSEELRAQAESRGWLISSGDEQDTPKIIDTLMAT